MKLSVIQPAILVSLYETAQFQKMPNSIRVGALITNTPMYRMRGLGQMTFMGVKVGGLVASILINPAFYTAHVSAHDMHT